uniref:Reverse transcriptase domain-containing protein n=1 Tax=Xiphophorus maculatus TaxID=8083 RepID=A0A3B5QAJ9_XIPMA
MSVSIDEVMECITIEIQFEKQKNIMVSCVYRAPASDTDIFTNYMETLFAKMHQKVIFICGDFNIDMLNPHMVKSTSNFIDSIHSLGLYPLITKPSRITTQSSTLIDNIFTNYMESKLRSGLLINDISDHLPVFVILEDVCRKINKVTNITYKRIISEDSIRALRNDLQSQNWKVLYEERNIDKAFDIFTKIFKAFYDKNCPIVTCNYRQKNKHKPWITKGIHNACKKKNNLYKQFIKYKTVEAEQKYKSYKNKLTIIMRKCKTDYYSKILENNKLNIKGIWKTLHSLIRKNSSNTTHPKYIIYNDKTLNEKVGIVNGFNEYFVNVGPTLAEQINKSNPLDVDSSEICIKQNTSSMYLKPVDKIEIKEIVNQCNNKKSMDWKDINMSLIKQIIDDVADPLTYICNLSFISGTFPNAMKIAKVIPLFKSGDKNIISNYRPVSLLCQFSKILEKVFSKRLDNFIEKQNILTDCQYGFREKRSTSMALMALTEEIIDNMDKKKCAIGVFLDLKKAFDTINHDMLLKKLERYGIRGVPLNWIRSYIGERKQFVELDGQKSDVLNITCGVPQGSVLGPKLFILYINDIVKISNLIKYIIFADDTSIFCTGENIQQLSKVINTEIEKLQHWLKNNKLFVNLDKTKFMIFGNNKKQENNPIKISIDSVNLEEIHEIKFLGVTLDNKFSWKPHIGQVKSKIAKSVAVIRRINFVL